MYTGVSIVVVVVVVTPRAEKGEEPKKQRDRRCNR
jgi:hypothetical protein